MLVHNAVPGNYDAAKAAAAASKAAKKAAGKAAGNAPSKGRMSKDAIAKRMGAVAEGKGWRKALADGEQGIARPDRKNLNTGGFDYATYDPKVGRIKIYDAKYRADRSYPKSIDGAKQARWKSELRDFLEKQYTGSDKDALLKKLDAGQVDFEVFGWPSN